jgi:hypothetical protein
MDWFRYSYRRTSFSVLFFSTCDSFLRTRSNPHHHTTRPHRIPLNHYHSENGTNRVPMTTDIDISQKKLPPVNSKNTSRLSADYTFAFGVRCACSHVADEPRGEEQTGAVSLIPRQPYYQSCDNISSPIITFHDITSHRFR